MLFLALLFFLACVGLGWRAARHLQRRLAFRALLLEQLALAARRGLPLHTGLAWAAEECEDRERAIVLAIEEDLSSGAAPSEALRVAGPRVAPPHVLAAIRAADGSPRLPETLETAANDGRETARFVHRTWLALVYPLTVGVGVAMTASRWEEIFGRNAYGLIGQMDVVGSAAQIAVVVLGAAATALLLAVWRPGFDRLPGRWTGAVHTWAARLPFLGSVLALDEAARVLGALSSFAAAGEPFDIALAESANAAGNPRTGDRVREAADRAAHGEAPERVWEVLPVPEFARVRGAVACTRAPPLFAADLADLSRACRVRWRARIDGVAALAQPAALVVVGALIAVQYGTVLRTAELINEAHALW